MSTDRLRGCWYLLCLMTCHTEPHTCPSDSLSSPIIHHLMSSTLNHFHLSQLRPLFIGRMIGINLQRRKEISNRLRPDRHGSVSTDAYLCHEKYQNPSIGHGCLVCITTSPGNARFADQCDQASTCKANRRRKLRSSRPVKVYV